MPAATTKPDLIAVTEKEFAKLQAVLAKVPGHRALEKDGDDTSIKDVVAHRAHWIDLFFGWFADGQEGRDIALPAPGYKWSELRRYNADLRAATAGMDCDEAIEALRAAHARLMGFLGGLDDATLYGGPMPGGGNAWTPGRWAEAAGASHYRSAAKYIRARLRGFKD